MFRTDSNGCGVVERRRNYRPTWSLNLTEPVASNYYPVDSRIDISEDSNDLYRGGREITILTDRAQGGSSMKSGQIELMLHRRLFNDDAFGVGEALNETAFGVGLVVRGKHRLVMRENSNNFDTISPRYEAEKILMKPVMFLGPSGSSIEVPEVPRFGKPNMSKNIKLLTLERWNSKSLLVRFENINEASDGECENVELQHGVKIIETTLDGNLKLQDQRRMSWNGYTQSSRDEVLDPTAIRLCPGEIRTFIVELIN